MSPRFAREMISRAGHGESLRATGGRTGVGLEVHGGAPSVYHSEDDIFEGNVVPRVEPGHLLAGRFGPPRGLGRVTTDATAT